jgi:hypothetical protein
MKTQAKPVPLFPWQELGISFDEWKKKIAEEKKKSAKVKPFFGGPRGFTK